MGQTVPVPKEVVPRPVTLSVVLLLCVCGSVLRLALLVFQALPHPTTTTTPVEVILLLLLLVVFFHMGMHANVHSYLLGHLDSLYMVYKAYSRSSKFFVQGFGGQNHVRVMHVLEDHWVQCGKSLGRALPYAPITVTFTQPPTDDTLPDCQAREGHFTSPVAALVPEEVREARFLMLVPQGFQTPWKDEGAGEEEGGHIGKRGGRQARELNGIVLLLTATGDEWYRSRFPVSRALLKHGYACMLLMAPYYGTRKQPEQKGHFVRDVDNYLMTGYASPLEGALMLEWAHLWCPNTPLCVSGFSWGSAMTGVASCMAALLGVPIAAVPYVGSATPATLLEGVLEDDIDFTGLTRDMTQPDDQAPPSHAVVRARLLEVLLEVHLARLVAHMKPLLLNEQHRARPLLALYAVGMKDDHFVPHAWSQELFDICASVCDGPRKMTWKPGGHVMAAIMAGKWQSEAIHETVKVARTLHPEP